MPKTLATLTVLALLMTAALACVGDQATNGNPPPNPTYTPASGTGVQSTGPLDTPAAIPANRPTLPESNGLISDQSTPQPTDDPDLRDITEQQHRQLDQQIADLQSSPQILAECAKEAGDPFPAAGSEGEADWYGQAAIRYSACAASKATGVDLTGGN